MRSLLSTIKRVINEKDEKNIIKDLGKGLLGDGSNVEMTDRLENLIKRMGFGSSLRRVSVIGHGRLIVYFSDDGEARRLHDHLNKILRDKDLKVTYKDLHVGRSKAGLIFDFTKI